MQKLITITSTFLFLFSSVQAHSFLAEPASARRNDFGKTCQPQWSPNSPCCASRDIAKPSATVYKRGQQVEFKWPRNNHAGGFIRLAVARFQDSDSYEAFNNGVFHYNCHESKCQGFIKDDPYSYDNTPDHQNLCSSTFVIPNWLPNGQYTIQWTWFGGGIWYNNFNKGQTSYQSCMDFTISGDEPVVPKPAGQCPTFKGGDSHFPGQDTCRYFLSSNTKELGIRTCDDGCDGTWTSGKPAALNQCTPGDSSEDSLSGGTPSNTLVSQPPTTTQSPTGSKPVYPTGKGKCTKKSTY